MVEENWISYDVHVTEKWHLKNSEGRAIYWSVDRCSSWPCFDTVAQLLPVDEFQALHECSANRAVHGWKKNKKYHRVHLSVEKTLYKSNCIDSLFTEHSFFLNVTFTFSVLHHKASLYWSGELKIHFVWNHFHLPEMSLLPRFRAQTGSHKDSSTGTHTHSHLCSNPSATQ